MLVPLLTRDAEGADGDDGNQGPVCGTLASEALEEPVPAEVLLIATSQNLKRLLGLGDRGRRPFPTGAVSISMLTPQPMLAIIT